MQTLENNCREEKSNVKVKSSWKGIKTYFLKKIVMACYLHEVLRLSARVEDGGDDDEGEGDEVEEEGRDHTGCCLQSHLVVESEKWKLKRNGGNEN